MGSVGRGAEMRLPKRGPTLRKAQVSRVTGPTPAAWGCSVASVQKYVDGGASPGRAEQCPVLSVQRGTPARRRAAETGVRVRTGGWTARWTWGPAHQPEEPPHPKPAAPPPPPPAAPAPRHPLLLLLGLYPSVSPPSASSLCPSAFPALSFIPALPSVSPPSRPFPSFSLNLLSVCLSFPFLLFSFLFFPVSCSLRLSLTHTHTHAHACTITHTLRDQPSVSRSPAALSTS